MPRFTANVQSDSDENHRVIRGAASPFPANGVDGFPHLVNRGQLCGS